MDVNFQDSGGIKIIEMDGELNSDTSTPTYDQIMNHITPQDKVVLEMTNVNYMSSAGIRTLLLIYRSLINAGGKVVLVGLSEDLRDTLSITGFLEFFNIQNTLDAGIQAVKS
ncbi:MAG: STAS domain-containing protein [Chloroflexota bacterium]